MAARLTTLVLLFFALVVHVSTDARAAEDLQTTLAPLLKHRVVKSSDIAMQIVDLETGEVVFKYQDGRQLVPASAMKVITAATALDSLGPDYRFETKVYSSKRIPASGVLAGSLYVKGGGDPTMVVEQMWRLIRSLKSKGLKTINGDVVFDDSYFDAIRRLPGWDKEEDIEDGPSYFAPSSALSLNFNSAAIIVGPGAEVGGAARALLEVEAGEYIDLVNEVTTAPVGRRSRLEVEREVVGNSMRFTLRGTVASDQEPFSVYRTVEHPTRYFQAVFRSMLKEQGIRVVGKFKTGPTPAAATLVHVHKSTPLAVVLMDMNKFSNNFIAEQVLKTTHAQSQEGPGTTKGGVELASAVLLKAGVSSTEFTLRNGSGLSREIKLSPRALTSLMRWASLHPDFGPEFSASLAIGGRDGTLRRRMTDHPFRVRGKTGTIDGIHALTGVVRAANGRSYAFAFLGNRLRGPTRHTREFYDQVVETLLKPEVE